MTTGYSEHPEATNERLEAIRYYHVEHAGRGEDLAQRIGHAIRDVVDSPKAWPPFLGWDGEPLVRSRNVAVYPYRIVYYVRASEVVILAYAHQKRRPGYWARRLLRP